MATNTDKLMERALDAQRRLEERGLRDEARVMLDLIAEVQALQAPEDRQFYTTSEAGRIIGVSAQTIKNWVARGLLVGYRLGGRTVIPHAALEEYRTLGAALDAIEPLPAVEQVVDDLRAQRKPVTWPSADNGAPSQREADK